MCWSYSAHGLARAAMAIGYSAAAIAAATIAVVFFGVPIAAQAALGRLPGACAGWSIPRRLLEAGRPARCW
jgi:hypothetical protein